MKLRIGQILLPTSDFLIERATNNDYLEAMKEFTVICHHTKTTKGRINLSVIALHPSFDEIEFPKPFTIDHPKFDIDTIPTYSLQLDFSKQVHLVKGVLPIYSN